MIAAFGTLAFLTTLWLLVVVGAMILGESGGKVAAALRGHSVNPAMKTAPVRLRHRYRSGRTLRATPRFRAAA